MRVLTVCIGNVCRSPLMERLLKDRLPDAAAVESAGVRAMVGRPMDVSAAAELVRLGGVQNGFVARQLKPPMLREVDLVLTATTEVRSRVLEDAPGALRRTFTLREFAFLAGQAPDEVRTPEELVAWAARHRALASGEELDVVDPMGRSAEVHREAADLIDDATRRIADALDRSAPVRPE